VEIIQVKLASGEIVQFEGTSGGGEEQIGTFDGFMDATVITQTIENTLAIIKDSIETIKPKKVIVKFGIKVAMKSGKLMALVTEGSGEANLEVSFEWQNS